MLFTSIYSVFFFGVPHRGLNQYAIERVVAGEATKGLIEELKEGSTLLTTLSERFSEAARDVKLITCRELIETPTTEQHGDKWERTGPSAMMVTETAANLFSVNEERIPIHKNRSMIAKLSDEPGSACHAIRDFIRSHLR